MPSVMEITTKLNKLLTAWEELAPEAVFAGYTREQFQAAVQPVLDAYEKVSWTRQEQSSALAERRKASESGYDLYYLVVNAIKGTPEHGENSPLYASLGYKTKNARRSGLTRKSKTSQVKSAAAETSGRPESDR